MHLICHEDDDDRQTIHILNATMNGETYSCVNVLLEFRHIMMITIEARSLRPKDARQIILMKRKTVTDLPPKHLKTKPTKKRPQRQKVTPPKYRNFNWWGYLYECETFIHIWTFERSLRTNHVTSSSPISSSPSLSPNVCIALWWSKHLSLRSINCFRSRTS